MEPLEFGKYYHIYNRGINGCNLFNSRDNYLHFLNLYRKYILPVSENYAWCLMNNHFHFLVRLKLEEEISQHIENPSRFLSQQYSNFFNAYSKAFNKRFHRHGALFERPFRRKLIDGQDYLLRLIVYIHKNPVNHGVVLKPEQYQWSSYRYVLGNNSDIIDELGIIKHFQNIENFIFVHCQQKDSMMIPNW